MKDEQDHFEVLYNSKTPDTSQRELAKQPVLIGQAFIA